MEAWAQVAGPGGHICRRALLPRAAYVQSSSAPGSALENLAPHFGAQSGAGPSEHSGQRPAARQGSRGESRVPKALQQAGSGEGTEVHCAALMSCSVERKQPGTAV